MNKWRRSYCRFISKTCGLFGENRVTPYSKKIRETFKGWYGKTYSMLLERYSKDLGNTFRNFILRLTHYYIVLYYGRKSFLRILETSLLSINFVMPFDNGAISNSDTYFNREKGGLHYLRKVKLFNYSTKNWVSRCSFWRKVFQC